MMQPWFWYSMTIITAATAAVFFVACVLVVTRGPVRFGYRIALGLLATGLAYQAMINLGRAGGIMIFDTSWPIWVLKDLALAIFAVMLLRDRFKIRGL